MSASTCAETELFSKPTNTAVNRGSLFASLPNYRFSRHGYSWNRGFCLSHGFRRTGAFVQFRYTDILWFPSWLGIALHHPPSTNPFLLIHFARIVFCTALTVGLSGTRLLGWPARGSATASGQCPKGKQSAVSLPWRRWTDDHSVFCSWRTGASVAAGGGKKKAKSVVMYG